jgi:eukaryotic-like serine/threonine-protein kinase
MNGNPNAPLEREREIFLGALDRTLPQDREAFLDRACGNDASLRARVAALLQSHGEADFLEEPAPDFKPGPEAELAVDEGISTAIGRYKLREKIGEGGCGVVYMAEQEAPVRRQAALKVIKLGMDTKSVVGRFEAERQALAMMDHPNIAKVFDAGATGSGRPYFVMELVRGAKVTDYCDQNSLAIRERLELVIKVCQAVQHAHQKGIIHRDLKPSNILVTVHDGVAMPKVIDFGIAKATEGRLSDKTIYTETRQFIGTPAYMSPEQAELTSGDIDTRSDIYSLGALLYELLTGRTPFDHQELLKLGVDSMRQIIRQKEPLRPSTRLSTLAAADIACVAQWRHAEPLKLVRLLRGDLDWIVMKCLEKDRTRRYETANGVAADLQRHLNNEPVTASPPSNLYRFQKLVRRNKLAFTAGVAVAATLIFGLIVSSWSLIKEQQARQRAVAAENTQLALRREADTARKAAEMTLAAADFSEANRLIAAEDGPDAVAYLLRILSTDANNGAALTRLATLITYHSWMMPTLSLKHENWVVSAQFSPDGKRIATGSSDGTARVWDAQTGQPLTKPLKHGDVVNSVQFSPDGARIVTASSDGAARIWDAPTGHLMMAPLKHESSVVYAEFSVDGTRVVTASYDNTARVWDVRTGQPLTEPLRHADSVRSAHFSPDGARIVTASADGTARVWDAQTGRPLTRPLIHGDYVRSAQFGPDGKRVVTASHDGTARVWDAQTGQPLTEPLRHGDFVVSAQFSPNGKRVVTASQDGTARVWDAQTGKPGTAPLRHLRAVESAEFSSDGRRVVTASQDGTAQVWDAQTGDPLSQPLQAGGAIWSAHFSPEGQRVVTASADGTARVWDPITSPPLTEPLRHQASVRSAQFSPDGKRVLTASFDSTAQVWDAQTGQPAGMPLKHRGAVNSARFSPDGEWIVTASWDNTARVWDAQTSQPLSDPLSHGARVNYAEFSPDGKRVVTASEDRSARMWNAQTGQRLTTPLKHEGTVASAVFSADARYIVTAAWDATARVWDADTGQVLRETLKHGKPVAYAQFSPDSKRVVTASADMSARVWDWQTGQPLTEPLKHSDFVLSTQFSPDGQRVVTASRDDTARLWDANTGHALTEPLKHGGPVNFAGFSPDGKRVVTASADGTARVWDTQTGQPLTEPLRHLKEVRSAQFSPDGRRIVTASADGTARVWDIGFVSSNCPAWLLQLAEALSGRRLNKQGLLEDTSFNRVETINQIRLFLKSQPEGGDGVLWGRWLLADPYNRTVSPFSSLTVSEYTENRIKEATAESLDEAQQLAPGNAELLQRISEARMVAESRSQADALRSTANSLARAGQWTNAIAGFYKLVQLDLADQQNYYLLGPLLARTGDVEGYRRHCAQLLALVRGTADPITAERTAKDCLILPVAGVDLSTVAQLADTAVTMGRTHPYLRSFEFVKGLAEYRQGHFTSSVEWMRKVLADPGASFLSAETYCVLAMALDQSGKPAESRAALGKGVQITQTKLPTLESGDLGNDWKDWIITQALLSEAKDLIEASSAAGERPASK